MPILSEQQVKELKQLRHQPLYEFLYHIKNNMENLPIDQVYIQISSKTGVFSLDVPFKLSWLVDKLPVHNQIIIDHMGQLDKTLIIMAKSTSTQATSFEELGNYLLSLIHANSNTVLNQPIPLILWNNLSSKRPTLTPRLNLMQSLTSPLGVACEPKPLTYDFNSESSMHADLGIFVVSSFTEYVENLNKIKLIWNAVSPFQRCIELIEEKYVKKDSE